MFWDVSLRIGSVCCQRYPGFGMSVLQLDRVSPICLASSLAVAQHLRCIVPCAAQSLCYAPACMMRHEASSRIVCGRGVYRAADTLSLGC